MLEWHLYLVRTRQGSLYTGIATDVTRRMGEHESDRGAKYLRSRGPLELVYQTKIGDRSLALRAEHGMKKLAKSQKEAIIAGAPAGDDLLAILGLSEEASL
jgi:putative endonuclease